MLGVACRDSEQEWSLTPHTHGAVREIFPLCTHLLAIILAMTIEPKITYKLYS